MVVDGLAATLGLLGLLGDGSTATGEPGGSIDDPAREGYGAHGVDFRECGIRNQSPLMDATPLMSRKPGKISPSVKSKSGHSGELWDDVASIVVFRVANQADRARNRPARAP